MSARGFWTGLLLGVIGGLMFAPAEGKAFRASLKKAAKAMKNDLDNPYGKTRSLLDKARFRVESHIDDYRHERKARHTARAKSREGGYSDEAFAE
jgi:gas vesicle protein